MRSGDETNDSFSTQKEEIAKAEKYQNVSWEQGLVGVGHSAVTCKASLQHLLTV